MEIYGGVLPFLEENEHIGQATWKKMLDILHDT